MVARMWVQQRELLVIANFKEADKALLSRELRGRRGRSPAVFSLQHPRPCSRTRSGAIAVPSGKSAQGGDTQVPRPDREWVVEDEGKVLVLKSQKSVGLKTQRGPGLILN